MLQGESVNGGCSMEHAKGMRELSERRVAFLGMGPGEGCKMWHVNKDSKEVRRLPTWIHRTEVSCCEDTQNQDSKAGICLIHVRNSKEAGIWGRMLTGGSRISDLRVMQAIVHCRHRCSSSGWGGGHWGAPSRSVVWSLDGRRPGKELAKARNNGITGQSGRREGHCVSN